MMRNELKDFNKKLSELRQPRLNQEKFYKEKIKMIVEISRIKEEAIEVEEEALIMKTCIKTEQEEDREIKRLVVEAIEVMTAIGEVVTEKIITEGDREVAKKSIIEVVIEVVTTEEEAAVQVLKREVVKEVVIKEAEEGLTVMIIREMTDRKEIHITL